MQFRRHAIVGLSVAVLAIAAPAFAQEPISDSDRLELGIRLLTNDTDADDAEAVATLNLITDERLKALANWPLGRAYLFGQGVPQDLTRGGRMMALAVEAAPDNTDARFLLARSRQQGWGLPVDPTAAFRDFRIAAEPGDPRAQWHVGMALLNGAGAPQDPVLARRFVTASAEGGHVEGMVSMAVMLALGEAGPKDPMMAREWYQRAAEAGSAHALRGLAGMLMIGEGGAVDTVSAAAYLDLAAKAGDGAAVQLQQAFADRIAAADRHRIEVVRNAWLREHGTPR